MPVTGAWRDQPSIIPKNPAERPRAERGPDRLITARIPIVATQAYLHVRRKKRTCSSLNARCSVVYFLIAWVESL